MLPQKGITVYDGDKDTVREMRYCPNEPSIWADEQGDNARKETVAFREGKLFVHKDKPNLRKFMDLHPMNIGNGGKVFKQVDKKQAPSLRNGRGINTARNIYSSETDAWGSARYGLAGALCLK